MKPTFPKGFRTFFPKNGACTQINGKGLALMTFLVPLTFSMGIVAITLLTQFMYFCANFIVTLVAIGQPRPSNLIDSQNQITNSALFYKIANAAIEQPLTLIALLSFVATIGILSNQRGLSEASRIVGGVLSLVAMGGVFATASWWWSIPLGYACLFVHITSAFRCCCSDSEASVTDHDSI